MKQAVVRYLGGPRDGQVVERMSDGRYPREILIPEHGGFYIRARKSMSRKGPIGEGVLAWRLGEPE